MILSFMFIILKLLIQYLLQDINSIEDHLDSSKISMKTTRPSWSSYQNLYWFVAKNSLMMKNKLDVRYKTCFLFFIHLIILIY